MATQGTGGGFVVESKLAVIRFSSNERGMNVGDIIDGKYRIESKLGSGGMAIVYAARHLKLGEDVALKFLDPKLRASRDAKTRFAREAKAAFMLRSKHVVRTFDVGSTPDGTPFIVMELLKGQTLAKYVELYGRPSVRDAISFAAQACEGVAEAHARGITHRDIKPENLFVTPRTNDTPLVRVLDFGISKAVLGENENSLTGTNEMIGTPEFMAPEQFTHAKTSDPRADVWSLGIILYWLLTGKTPFEAPSPMGVMSAILTRKPTGASLVNPSVPREIDAVILKCITQEKNSRYADAADLFRALQPHLTVKPAPVIGLFEGPPSSGQTEPHTQRSFSPPSFQGADAHATSDMGEDAPTQANPQPAVRLLKDEVAEEATIPKGAPLQERVPSSARTAVMAQRVSSVPAPPPDWQDRSSQIPIPAPPPKKIQPPFIATIPLAQPSPVAQIDPRVALGRSSFPPQIPQAPLAPPAPRPSQAPPIFTNPAPPQMPPLTNEPIENRKIVSAIILGILGVIIGVFLMLSVRACSQDRRP